MKDLFRLPFDTRIVSLTNGTMYGSVEFYIFFRPAACRERDEREAISARSKDDRVIRVHKE